LAVRSATFHNDFANRVSAPRHSLPAPLVSEKAKGNRIACYGAAAKGAMLVNYLDLGGKGSSNSWPTLNPSNRASTCPVSASRFDIRIRWRRTKQTTSSSSFGISQGR
jgi:C-methyltransferase C-terminal domain